MPRKILSVILIVLLVIVSSSVAMAGDRELNLRESNELVEAIASGSDEVAGGGVAFEYDPGEGADGDITVKWADGGINHTHQYILSQALMILRNDKGDKVANLLTKYASTLLPGADWPDANENDFSLYLGHFYDPYTGKTILGISSPTALTRFLEHADNAKKYYAKNRTASMRELGRAIHYLSDANVPHHAALLTALDSNHSAFEAYADAARANYSVSTTAFYSGITAADAKTQYAAYCREIVNISARHALGYVAPATSGDAADWSIAAEASMEYSQQITAAFLYNFLRSVNAVK